MNLFVGIATQILRMTSTFFFGCMQAQHVWVAAGLWHQIEGAIFQAKNSIDLTFTLLEDLVDYENESLALTLWCI